MQKSLEPALQIAIEHCLRRNSFYSCCLLVHPNMARLREAEESLKKQYSWTCLSLGSVLATALLPLSEKERVRQTPIILKKVVQDFAPGPLLCTNISILFEPSLALDPLYLLKEISRQVFIIVTWSGSFFDDVLTYACSQPPHAHYRAWRGTDIKEPCIITL